MLQRFLVSAAFFGGELAGAFVELRGHIGGFFGGTTEGDKDLGELGNFHGENINWENKNAGSGKIFSDILRFRFNFYFTESRGTMVMLMMPMRLSGRSCGCVGVVAIFSSTSSPLISLPNVVY